MGSSIAVRKKGEHERSRLENDWLRRADVRRARRTGLFSN